MAGETIVRKALSVIVVFALFIARSAAGPLSNHVVVRDGSLASSNRLLRREFNVGSCRRWVTSQPWDTCAGFLLTYGLSMSKFWQLNPSVDSDCYFFVPGATYCLKGRKTSEF